MGILIENRQKQHQISTTQIQKIAQALLNALGSPDSELSILILDDLQIEQLNNQYRHRQGPTNVLSFPMHEGEFSAINPQLLGDVVISIETAAKEARQMGIDTDQRFNFLLIHGLLHLFGYDHETDEDQAETMEQKSQELSTIIKNL